jgi:hypothetical protein
MTGQPQYAQPNVTSPYGGGFLAPSFDRNGVSTPSGGFRPRVDSFSPFAGSTLFSPFWYGDPTYGAAVPNGYYYSPYGNQSPRWSRGYGDRNGAALTLQIYPGHAAIYLDGNLVGTADEIARSGGSLRVVPGTHLLEVAAPGYRSLSVEFRLRPGQSLTLSRRLKPAR